MNITTFKEAKANMENKIHIKKEATSCSECGAPNVNGKNCWEQFLEVLAWEADDPELLAEHFKTVASYNMQHPSQFTDSVLTEFRSVFIEHLDNGIPIKEIRRRIGKVSEGKNRILKNESERHPIRYYWKKTISDIYNLNQPENAAQRVRDWAATIRQELNKNRF